MSCREQILVEIFDVAERSDIVRQQQTEQLNESYYYSFLWLSEWKYMMKSSQNQNHINNLAVHTLFMPNAFLTVVLTVLELF